MDEGTPRAFKLEQCPIMKISEERTTISKGDVIPWHARLKTILYNDKLTKENILPWIGCINFCMSGMVEAFEKAQLLEPNTVQSFEVRLPAAKSEDQRESVRWKIVSQKEALTPKYPAADLF